MNTLLQDIRYGLRMLLKQKGFTAVAIVALALGIGANTAIFSLVNGVLLRPLPYPDADQIVYFEGRNPEKGITNSNISVPDYNDWAKQEQLFASIAIFSAGNGTLTDSNAEPERVPRAGVSSSFFTVLGVQPTLGRSFVPEDDRPEGDLAAVLSEGLWRRRFGGDPTIIGKPITVNGRPTTVVGIMPAGFEFPGETQLWTTQRIVGEQPRDNRAYSAIARLKPGIHLEQAQSQINGVNAQLAQAYPDTNKGWEVNLARLHDRLVRGVRPSLLALLGAVAFVLLIACANVANLLLARAAARRKEVAIRTALGASRTRVIRQMLTESVMLSAIGGVFGLILSVWLTDLLVSISPANSPRFAEVHLDVRVLVFTLAITAATGLLFGLAPALQASKLDVSSSLKVGGRTGEGSHRTSVRSLLLIGEVALSLVLLVGAGLLMKSFMRLQEVKPGFNAERVLIASISLPGGKYKEDHQLVEFHRQLRERLTALPGVQSVGAGVNLPLGASNYGIGRAFIPEGRPLVAEESLNASYSVTTPGYFETLQIPLLAGRTFNDRDQAESPKVVVINRTAAEKHFGSETAAIGRRLSVWRDEKFPREIVGVVGDTKPSTLEREAGAQIYVPQTQDVWSFMTYVIRTAGDPESLVSAVRREVRALDPDLPIFNVRTMEDVVRDSIGSRRISAVLFSVFAGVALLLATLGIYGVMAYSVTQRTQEIGIRMALGAQASDVLRMVVRQGMTLTLVGIGAGLLGAFALTRIIARLLFGVGANDPATYSAISLLLVAVSFLACYFPARRAAKVDPMIALARGS
jgi:putative ABC transport system permease protein